MIEIANLASDFPQIHEKEFSLVLFYANGCKHCETLKLHAEELSKLYPEIGFFKVEMSVGYQAYADFAEKEPEYKYEAIGDTGETNKIPVLNDDGTPVMSIKFVIPSIYFYHTKNISETNPTGYIGGIDGANVEEFKAVLDDLRRMYYNGLEEEATQRS